MRFFGGSLWTDFTLFGEGKRFFAMQTARQRMTDFSLIHSQGKRFTPEDTPRLHGASRGWLALMLAGPFDGRTVVVTYHAPSSRSVHPRHARGLLTAVFASSVEMLMDSDRAALWVHGHMHGAFDYEIYGTRVVCNPRGYAPRDLSPDFQPGLAVEI